MSLNSFLSACALMAASLFISSCKNAGNSQATATDPIDSARITGVRFIADSAFATIKAQCDFGPRVPNSEAHRRCGDYIAARFKALGLEVTEQKASLTAWDGNVLQTRNIIAAYRPELTDRIIICTHWESRPWADADPDSTRHREPVMAANDGASGVGVMLEVARLLEQLNPCVGIDFICFDSEDYGAPYWEEGPDDGTDWCMGSRYWANHPHREGYAARYGILLDMVGGKDARFCYEGVSLRYARDIVLRTWETAALAGAGKYFLQQEGGWAQDDHVPMNEIAGIPTIDIIPFVDGAHSFGATWHTVHDTPENISTETLQAVGQTLVQLISEENNINE